MPVFDDFDQFARQLERVQRRLPIEIEKAVRDTGRYAVRKAKAKIGVYQEDYVTPQGEWFPDWEPLHESTLWGGVAPNGYRFDGKIPLGYSPPDNPLLREGDLRNSISFTLSGTWHADVLILGSTDRVMLYHEFGTIWMAPRPVIGPAMAETVQEMHLKRLREAVAFAFAA